MSVELSRPIPGVEGNESLRTWLVLDWFRFLQSASQYDPSGTKSESSKPTRIDHRGSLGPAGLNKLLIGSSSPGLPFIIKPNLTVGNWLVQTVSVRLCPHQFVCPVALRLFPPPIISAANAESG